MSKRKINKRYEKSYFQSNDKCSSYELMKSMTDHTNNISEAKRLSKKYRKK